MFKTLTALKNSYWIGLLAIALIMVGLLLSRFCISLGIALLVINFLLQPDYKIVKQRFRANNTLWILPILCLLYIISGLYSADVNEWLWRTRTKLPFLLLPITFAVLPSLQKKHFHWLLNLFLVLMGIGIFYSLSQYISNYAEITESYFRGKTLPTLIHHVRFSLLIAYAVIICFYFYQKTKINQVIAYFYAGTGLFMLIFLHILAVRSGLLALYCCVFYLLWSSKILSKQYKIILLATSFTLVFLSINYMPTLSNKLNYVKYDLHQIWHNKSIEGASDSRRIIAILTGIEVGNTAPLFGVGAGDVRSEMEVLFIAKKSELANSNYLTHNQFVFIYAALGIFGLLLFLAGMIYIFMFFHRSDKILLICLNIIIFTSFLAEDTLEGELGTTFYLLFLLLEIQYYFFDKSELSNLKTFKNK